MADAGRQSFTDKVKDTVTPDSQKSTLDQAGDKIKGKTDDAAGSVQPDSEKSTTQKIGDSTSDTLKSASEQGKSLLGQAQEAISGAAKSVSDTLSGEQKK